MSTEVLISHTTVTLHRGQGHCAQVFEFLCNCDLEWRPRPFRLISISSSERLNGLYHRNISERNWSANVWRWANVKSLFSDKGTHVILSHRRWSEKGKWVWGYQQYPTLSLNQLRTLWDNWRLSFYFLASLWPRIKVKVTDYNQNVQFSSVYHHTKFEQNQFINICMYAWIEAFWCSQ